MRYTKPRHCFSFDFFRYIRDSRPTEAELLAWLGPTEQGRYHVLRKAGILLLQDGRVILSPQYLSADGRRFYWGNEGFHLDEEAIYTFVVRRERDDARTED